MKKQLLHSFFLSLSFIFLASCASSPGVIGTQASISSSSTAAARTPTLVPKKTPTQTPTITPTVTPTPTTTPQGGSNQVLIVGRLGNFTGVPSIYIYDSKIGISNLLFENYNLASISPDEKHLMVYVCDWKASRYGPIVGELYLTTLEGTNPILIAQIFSQMDRRPGPVPIPSPSVK